MWGLVFITPVLLSDYPAAILSVGRYLAFGLIALPLALIDRDAVGRLERADWIEAAKLSLIGNLLYYGCLAAAIQASGAPLPTMLIGTLPVIIAVMSNLAQRQLPWRLLAVSLSLIAAGIALVNRDELALLAASSPDPGQGSRYWLGTLLALGAVACWTWYPIRNAIWLNKRPGLASGTWATVQGLTTLPLALAGALALYAVQHASGGTSMLTGGAFEWPFGARPVPFAVLMLVLGLTASWLGTLLWNRASQLLPTALSGQLIVFETLSALLYAYVLRGQVPAAGTLAGIVLLVLGVIAGVRAFAQQASMPPH